MISSSLAEKIEQISFPFLEMLGVELVDLMVHQSRSNINVQILVDKPGGGITIAECAELNRQIGQAIESQNLIEHHYVLEVSSPGLDRPLKTKKDFLRALGRDVHVFLSEPVDGRIEYSGQVKLVNDQCLTLIINAQDVVVPLQKINKGKQVLC